jgi:hypothetical protein
MCPSFSARLNLFNFIAIILVFCGCVQTQVTKLSNRGSYDPIPPDEVVVYLTTEDIKSEFEKIGLIYAQGEASWTNEQQMIEAARKAAGKMGANGIVLGKVDEPSAGAKIAGALFGTGTTRRGEVLAVYVYDNSGSGWIDSGPARAVEATHKPVEAPRAIADPPVAAEKVHKVETPPVIETPTAVEQQELEPVTKLPNFRASVQAAKNYTDEQILDSYRKKYPRLQNISDSKLIALIEAKYKKK